MRYPAAALISAALAAAPAVAQVVQLIPNPAGRTLASARGISADGAALIAQFDTGFRWTSSGGWQPIGIASNIFGLSQDGSTAVGQTVPGGTGVGRAFYWRPPAAPVQLDFGVANAASADGSVIIGSVLESASARYVAFRWTLAGGYEFLPRPAGDSGAAQGVSADGSVVVGTFADSTSQPPFNRGFIWSAAAGVSEVPAPPGAGAGNVTPWAVSADGRIAVGQAINASGHPQAFRWTPGVGSRFINMPAGVQDSAALAASADGSVIVGITYPASGLPSGFIWDRVRGTRDIVQFLNSLGANLGQTRLVPAAISPDGAFIGASESAAPGRAAVAHVPAFCYANCDGSTVAPVLNVGDFLCFLGRFAANDPYVNCDSSTTPPTLNVADFLCFQVQFARGCP
jgi:uncharacterized membrane protein